MEAVDLTSDVETNGRQPIDSRERILMAVGDLHGDYFLCRHLCVRSHLYRDCIDGLYTFRVGIGAGLFRNYDDECRNGERRVFGELFQHLVCTASQRGLGVCRA